MTTRNLDALFAPAAITLIGASNKPGSVGAVIARNLISNGFDGLIMPVNPHETMIAGAKNYCSVSDLPATPDLAVIATPPASVPGLIKDLGARGCRAAIVITAGLDAAQRADMFEAARPHLMRIVGPNCLGFLSPLVGINASFAHLTPLKGDIAFVTQSGAVATSILDWANGRNIGFSHILSIGDMSDVDFGDLLDYLALDAATKAILLYVENVTAARKFISAGRIAARVKPVVVVKAGRGASGARAAASHTGALAGADIVYDAAFRRAGMLRVGSLRDLFDAVETLASGLRPRGDRLTILTNGGGLGVLATDVLEEMGGRLCTLSEEVIGRLDAVLPRAWPRANPVDILGDAHGARYAAAYEVLKAAPGQDAILAFNCPTGVADNKESVEALIRAYKCGVDPPLLACWMGDATAREPRRLLSKARVPNYETPDEAVRAFLHLAEYARNQEALLETPVASAAIPQASRAEAKAIIASVLEEGRAILTEPEAKRVLALYGTPVVETIVVATTAEAGEAAQKLAAPVALKILSRQITHKTDVGGVKLDLEGREAVESAAQAMREAVARAAPNAKIDGFAVQPMVRRPLAQELILGVVDDRTFGPALMFGQGGIAAEIVSDRVVGLPPLNSALALQMIERTRVAKLLAGYRGRPPADYAAIARALVALSDLVVDIPEIAELDINPLLADADGVIALDARIAVRRSARGEMRLAIKPYPAHLTHGIALDDGLRFTVRPICPADAPALVELGARTTQQDLRLRFHFVAGAIEPSMAARLSLIDYDREMAFVAVDGGGAIAGVVRLVFDPDFQAAEYAIIVRSDIQGHGLGRKLMAAILDHARASGATLVWGDVLTENVNMLAMARALGASCVLHAGEPELTRTEFRFA